VIDVHSKLDHAASIVAEWRSGRVAEWQSGRVSILRAENHFATLPPARLIL
jgi:hypothetical protein